MHLRQLALTAPVIALGLSLVACASGNPEQPVSLGPPALSPTATEPAAAEYPAPDRVFDGSCAALFSEAEVSEILGTPETLRLSGVGLDVAKLRLPHYAECASMSA